MYTEINTGNLGQERLQPTRLVTRTKESNMCASVMVNKPGRSVKAKSCQGESPQQRPVPEMGFVPEYTCWDPKDGELCLSTMKPEETLVEVGSDADVQIARRTWV